MKKISLKEVQELLASVNGTNEFAEPISKLEKGEALQIAKSEWKRKTNPSTYFAQSINKKEKIVRCKNVGENILIIKL